MPKKPQDDQRSDDQDAALEEAFVAGTLPDDNRRDEGAEVKLPSLSTDAGASLQKDNATTPGHLNGGNNG